MRKYISDIRNYCVRMVSDGDVHAMGMRWVDHRMNIIIMNMEYIIIVVVVVVVVAIAVVVNS